MERGREKFQRYKCVINVISNIYALLPKRFLNMLLVFHRNTKGYLGLVLRYAILKNLVISIGDNVSIHPDIYLFNVAELKIGNNVSIHPMSYIDAYGGISIGDNVSIAHNVTLMSANHTFSDIDIPIKDQPIERKPIKIGNNCWIGAQVVVLGNVTISEGSIVGAGSVVTKNVGEFSIVVGKTASVLKRRR